MGRLEGREGSLEECGMGCADTRDSALTLDGEKWLWSSASRRLGLGDPTTGNFNKLWYNLVKPSRNGLSSSLGFRPWKGWGMQWMKRSGRRAKADGEPLLEGIQ